MARAAVVTGSTRGIGRAIVRALLDVGYGVALNYRSHAPSARDAAREFKGRDHVVVKSDVSRPAGARSLIAAARKRWGRIDLLVNNDGDFFETTVSKMKLEAWDELWSSNVRTALLCAREALPHLRKTGGSIVNLGGTATQMLKGNPTYVAYAMAKTALLTFTKSLARAEAARGVRVNMVAPGYIRTYAYTAEDLRTMPAQVPMRRLGRPEDVAEAVAWLASDKAGYVTGAVLDVAGGLGV